MKKISEKQLTDHVNLVKWQQKKLTEKFNLLTVHSLLVNSNPKFIQLKQKIQNFNSSIAKGVDRKHLQYEYINKLYQMLRQLVSIANYENQVQFLNNVYQWSKQGLRTQFEFDQSSQGTKSRPTTANTRARPFSAYSRPKSGTTKISMAKLQEPLQIKQQNKTKINIDYEKLKSGDIQFYTGARTLHSNQQNPNLKLKQYQRKIFYEEEPDSDIEIIDLKQNKETPMFHRSITVQNPVQEPIEEPIEQIKESEGLIQGGQQNPIGDDIPDGQDQINVDDLPMEGDIQEEQPQQVIDKLKPKLKAFIKHQTDLSKNKISYSKGTHTYLEERNGITRKRAQDQLIKEKMLEWARQKSRTKRQQKRRAQSARIPTKQIGIGYKKPELAQQNVNVINFQNIQVPQTKQSRPKTAFQALNQNNRKQLIKNCFITGKMTNHIQKFTIDFTDRNQRIMRITSLAQKPKKKTFQEILKEAEEKVKAEQVDQILNVKQTFAKNKVPFQTNRIAKSVTYHALGLDEEQDQEEQFVGHITGMNMINNPFFKVGKKKKKKKKKK